MERKQRRNRRLAIGATLAAACITVQGHAQREWQETKPIDLLSPAARETVERLGQLNELKADD
jgi:hypothetical protein